jgi:preprotein translocase subunit SecD
MLNKYPLWKYILILAVLAIGLIYSAPNLYPMTRPFRSAAPARLCRSIRPIWTASAPRCVNPDQRQGSFAGRQRQGRLIRLTKAEDQLPAKDVVRKALGDDYVVALNLAQTTPQWLRNLGAHPMKLGLDLSGGVHFLLEVDMDKALDARLKVYEGDVKSLLRKENCAIAACRNWAVPFSWASAMLTANRPVR